MDAKPSTAARLGRWAAELVLVFVGVYGAFWLNNYQEHQRDAKRRDLILASLEQQLKEGVTSAQTEAVRQSANAKEFRRALEAGEMPAIRPFAFVTDYSPTDMATLLQAGGIELLEIETLTALRDLESVIRGGLSRMEHYEKLSDELIAPNVDQESSFFYDPATKKLRKRFEKYPDALEASAKFFEEMSTTQRDLLVRIQAERAKDR